MAQRNINKWFPDGYYKPTLFWYKAKITPEKYGHNTVYKSYAQVSKIDRCFYALIHIDTICPHWHYGRRYFAQHFDTKKQAKKWCNFLMENPPKYVESEVSVWGSEEFKSAERYCKYYTRLGFPKHIEHKDIFGGRKLP